MQLPGTATPGILYGTLVTVSQNNTGKGKESNNPNYHMLQYLFYERVNKAYATFHL